MLRKLAALLVLIGCAWFQDAQAVAVDVKSCPNCTTAQLASAAIGTGRLGEVLIGDPATGILYRYFVEREPWMDGKYLYFAYPEGEPTAEQTELWYHAGAVWRNLGSKWSGALQLNMTSAVLAAASLPASAFDITTDNAAREQVRSYVAGAGWMSMFDSNSWLFSLQMVVKSANNVIKNFGFKITFVVKFSDGTTAVFEYNSDTNSVEFKEARDSSGNLIATNSSTGVQVDYGPTYLSPNARFLSDFDRAIQWFQLNGVPVVDPMIGIVSVGGIKPK